MIPAISSVNSVTASSMLKEIYKDLAKPSVVSLGIAFGTIAETSSTFILPLKLWQHKRKAIFEANIRKLELELKEAEKEGKTVVPCPPEIGCTVTESLCHVSDPELAELFVRLLRRASVKEESKLAHPRFASIVNSLSPDEARLLKATCHDDFFRCLSVRWEKTESNDGGIATTSYFLTDQCLTGIEKKFDILFPENIFKYLVSLQSLGLIEVHEDSHLDEYMTPHAEYVRLREFYKDRVKDNVLGEDGHTSRVLHGRITFTDFGLFFLEACVRPVKKVRKSRSKPNRQAVRFSL